MKTAGNRTTFTELLVIIAVIILLPSMLIAALDHVRDLAKISICAKNLKYIGVAVSEYAQIYDGNMPNVRLPEHIAPPGGRDEAHPYVAYRLEHTDPNTGELWPYRFACLYEANLIDPRLFYCPAETDPIRMYKSYTNPAQPNTSNEWGTLPQQYNTSTSSNQWVRCGYEWFPVDSDPNLNPISYGGRPRAPENLSRKFENVDPNFTYCVDSVRFKETISHRYREAVGVNALYIDGHVNYCDDPNVFSDGVWDMDISGRTFAETMSMYYYRFLLISGRQPHEDD